MRRSLSSGLAKNVIAFAALMPQPPSIVPGEKPARSRRIWSWIVSDPVDATVNGNRSGADSNSVWVCLTSGGVEPNLGDTTQVDVLPCLPEIAIVLHGKPTLRRTAKSF